MNMFENHNKIILKHENMLREMVTMQVYLTKNESFQKAIDARVQTALFGFNETMAVQLAKKLNTDEFYDKIRGKASAGDLAGFQLELGMNLVIIFPIYFDEFTFMLIATIKGNRKCINLFR